LTFTLTIISLFSQLQQSWTDLSQKLPFQIHKISFFSFVNKLDNHFLAIETQLLNEAQSLENGTSFNEVIKSHKKFFTERSVLEEVESCLNALETHADICRNYEPSLKDLQKLCKERYIVKLKFFLLI